MIQEYEQFRDSFSEKRIQIKNQKLNNIIQQYHFYHGSDDDVKNCFIQSELDLKDFFSNVCKYKLILIDQYEENNIKYFIIGQEKTIIILDQSSISLLNNFLINSTSIKACFLSNTETIFSQLIKWDDLKVKVNSFFQNEIKTFCTELKLKEKSQFDNIWNIIKPCISAYLIQKGYQQSNCDREFNLQFLYGNDFITISKMPELKSIEKDDYIELRNIGASTFNVILVYHIETGILCALKKNLDDYYLNSFLREREQKNYSLFEHPFMSKIIGINKSQDSLFIEFINGQRLDKIEGLTMEEKVDIIFELMMVIEYIHRKHFVYRDLKPDNIIIDQYKIAVLIDFDRMRSIDNLPDDYQLTNDFGTNSYMPPELSTVKNAYKGDIYSLGKVINYIMKYDFKNYPKMKEIYENCTKLDPKERPTIKELILDFFVEFRPHVLRNGITEEYFTDVFNEGIANVMSIIGYTDSNPFSIYKFGLLFYEGIYINKNIEKAIYYLDIAANNGEDTARIMLAEMNYKGIEVKQNIQKAIYYYSLNPYKNHCHDNFILGTIYYDNKYVPLDIEKAIYYFKLAADDKHDIACMYLAEIYNLYKHDNNKTIHYLKIAADDGFMDAQYYLGQFLYEGEIIEKDIQKAIYYLTLSANQNNSNAQNTLGWIFYKGEFVKKDMNKAIYFLTLAANDNNTEAQKLLGIIFYEGDGVKKDINKAIFYFKLAANDYPYAVNFCLGLIYHTGNEEIRDIDKAIYYYKIAADHDNCYAQYNLGYIYYYGYYVVRDISRAIHYFEQAAKQNHLQSLDMLGLIYIIDLNNIDKGLEYLTHASNQNYSDSEYILGLLYSQGKYIKINYVKALKYLVSASNHGNSDAQTYLGIIYLCGVFGTFDIHKSFEYFNISAKGNSRISQFFLGFFYFYGINVKQNTNIALRYFVDSSNNHYPFAYFMAGFLYHILNDIKNAIHYYKESSSFNRCYAKNNLGVIYRNCESYKNINFAIQYFEEAIKKTKDFIPFYNLANLYFFSDEVDNNLIKAIELLVKCNQRNFYINELLCLASMMEFGFEIENIKEELDKYDKNVSSQICEMIKNKNLNDNGVFEQLYNLHKENALIYALESSNCCILEKDIGVNFSNTKIRIKDITESFYEGFGLEIE